jgi:predicted transcriptional regulator
MKSRKVDSIIVPYTEEVPLTPSVALGEKITRAIELMLHHNLSRIAVVRNQRAIGVICLKDALQEIGLEMPAKS